MIYFGIMGLMWNSSAVWWCNGKLFADDCDVFKKRQNVRTMFATETNGGIIAVSTSLSF